jgi:hypothetical protein
MLSSLLLVLFSYLSTTLGGKGQGCQMYHTVELGHFAAPYWHMNNAIPAPYESPSKAAMASVRNNEQLQLRYMGKLVPNELFLRLAKNSSANTPAECSRLLGLTTSEGEVLSLAAQRRKLVFLQFFRDGCSTSSSVHFITA